MPVKAICPRCYYIKQHEECIEPKILEKHHIFPQRFYKKRNPYVIHICSECHDSIDKILLGYKKLTKKTYYRIHYYFLTHQNEATEKFIEQIIGAYKMSEEKKKFIPGVLTIGFRKKYKCKSKNTNKLLFRIGIEKIITIDEKSNVATVKVPIGKEGEVINRALSSPLVKYAKQKFRLKK